MPRTRNEARVEQARALASEGRTQQEVSAQLGIPLRTLQSWRDIDWPIGRPRVADGEASARTLRRRRQEGLALPELTLRARAPCLRRFPLFDAALLPAPVRDRLAVIGYWCCDPQLRGRVDGWDDLDDGDKRAAENDLRLIEGALAR